MKRYQFVIEFDAKDDQAAKEEERSLNWWVNTYVEKCNPAPKNVTTSLVKLPEKKETGG